MYIYICIYAFITTFVSPFSQFALATHILFTATTMN